MLEMIKKRIRNKYFLLALFGLIATAVKLFTGYDIPVQYSDLFNKALFILVTIGVVIDPTTPGLLDAKQTAQENIFIEN